MGAPRRWIKQLLGLKKSEKVVSSEEEENSSTTAGKTEHQSKNPVETDKGVSENENVDTEFEDANWQWREEWMGGVHAKEANFESAVDSPTSPEEESADQLEQDTAGEGWATPDVREMLDSDPELPSSPQGQYAAIFQENEREELAARCIQTKELQNGTKAKLPMSEESAAVLIQTVYRGFLAKRTFRALKGLSRLQAQVKGRIVKRQTAIALRCIQALVKVQVRSRAKHVLTAIEGQAVQQKLLQQLEHEAPVKKQEPFTYNGWCDKVGSAGEIQARMLKRKEAAAKREKAKAYALARQWQAGIRIQPQQQQQQQQQQPQQLQQTTHVGFPSNISEWGWNWLERWTAVRPWETQFLSDTSLRDGMKNPKSEQSAAIDIPTSPLFSTERKPVPSIRNGKLSPRLSNTIKVSNDGCSHSPMKLANLQETVSSKSPRTPVKDSATSRPIVGSRSFSTPKERSNLSDNQDKKRLSLPGTMHGARLLAQTAIKSPRPQSPRILSPRTLSPRTPQKPGNPRTKLNGNEVKPSKLSR